MMRLFAGGATTPLVVKIGTKQPWVKIENLSPLALKTAQTFNYFHFWAPGRQWHPLQKILLCQIDQHGHKNHPYAFNTVRTDIKLNIKICPLFQIP